MESLRSSDALGQYVKVNEQWFRVIGVVSPQLSSQSDSSSTPNIDVNNNIYIPLQSAFLALKTVIAMCATRSTVSISTWPTAPISLNRASRQGSSRFIASWSDDFSIIVPAELLAEQKRTENLFNTVMVAIASISLLVGASAS